MTDQREIWVVDYEICDRDGDYMTFIFGAFWSLSFAKSMVRKALNAPLEWNDLDGISWLNNPSDYHLESYVLTYPFNYTLEPPTLNDVCISRHVIGEINPGTFLKVKRDD